MARENSTVNEAVKPAGAVHPTENEIATVAYLLWLDSGCPIGWEQEHWFQAEAMLRKALAGECEQLSRGQSIPRCDTYTDSAMVAESTSERWDGHWEVWEREWGCARWVWDLCDSAVRVSNRAG